MKTSEVIRHFKTACQLAADCVKDGWPTTPAAISQWGEYPPQGRQRQIEIMTNGKLKATKPATK